MTAKVIKVSSSKGYRIEAIEIKGQKMISIRQLYATKNDPELKPAKQGITLPLEVGELAVAELIAKTIKRYATSDDIKFKNIDVGKDE